MPYSTLVGVRVAVCIGMSFGAARRRRENATSAAIRPTMHNSPTTPPTMLPISTASLSAGGVCDGKSIAVALVVVDIVAIVALD